MLLVSDDAADLSWTCFLQLWHHPLVKLAGTAHRQLSKSTKITPWLTVNRLRFVQTQARVELLNKLNGEAVFGITWMADRYDEEKYKRPARLPLWWCVTMATQGGFQHGSQEAMEKCLQKEKVSQIIEKASQFCHY